LIVTFSASRWRHTGTAGFSPRAFLGSLSHSASAVRYSASSARPFSYSASSAAWAGLTAHSAGGLLTVPLSATTTDHTTAGSYQARLIGRRRELPIAPAIVAKQGRAQNAGSVL